MTWLLPLPVAIPLLTAAAVVAIDHVVPRRVENGCTILAAAAATAFSILIMLQAQHGTDLHWFGGWRPDGNVALGIDFVADPLGAALAALACGLTLLALVYSWTYMREAAGMFDVLMLCFCGAMAGFALTGDIFDMFVWFELMGIAAYALAGFKIDELGPLQGAVNFAITNTAGAYMVLLGIGLLYARTGALNLAQIGRVLARHQGDRLVIVALGLLVAGYMVKSAIVPFHAWLADAYAVAPVPVCVLYAGAMSELGLYAIARLYWTVFDAPFGGHAQGIRMLLVWLGVATALLGALMCFLQRHLKRMLAFATIAHVGIVLAAIGLLDERGLAGAASLVLSHGFLKGGLFLVCGLVLLQLKDVDELRLHGAGRRLRWSAGLWFAGAIGLAGVPYLGVFLGHAQLDDGATGIGIAWLQPLLMIAAGVSAGTLLRAGARVFLGWGPRVDPLLTEQPPEEPAEREAFVPLMLGVATVAIALGLVFGVFPGLQARTEHAADRFMDRSAYAARVLHGKREPIPPRAPYTVEPATGESIGYGIGAGVLALLTAAVGLWHRRLPDAVRTLAGRTLGPPVTAIKGAHSGIVGDYLLWIVFGASLISGVWAIVLR
ncbi:MAG TPA: complex I subunit 5 family protein [Gaiellaceae bacterium]|nr:complex I subunit 5 family protein [Gaiellaceae bacterium]